MEVQGGGEEQKNIEGAVGKVEHVQQGTLWEGAVLCMYSCKETPRLCTRHPARSVQRWKEATRLSKLEKQQGAIMKGMWCMLRELRSYRKTPM